MNLNGFSFAISLSLPCRALAQIDTRRPTLQGRPNRSFLGVRSPRKSVTGPLGDGQVPNARARRRQARSESARILKELRAEGGAPLDRAATDTARADTYPIVIPAALISGHHLAISAF